MSLESGARQFDDVVESSQPFADRRHAGRVLAAELLKRDLDEPVVLALPRGGVPVAFEVSRALGVPLDIMIVRKIGAPQNPELALGAIADDGQIVLDERMLSALGISRRQLAGTIAAEQKELKRRRRLYVGGHEPTDVSGRTVILIDDGIATGSSAAAAARALRARQAARIVLAAPVGPQGVERALAGEFDEIVCLRQPRHFGGVGRWYRDFSPTSDAEVSELLAASRPGSPDRERPAAVTSEVPVLIDAGEGTRLHGDLRLPPEPRGLILFAHGSGSSRQSPRNRAVAGALNTEGFATLLLDLLSESEEAVRGNVFDIALLASRLLTATTWTRSEPTLRELPIGYFGASTGAGAALVAAAAAGDRIGAVVSRGGRPDLAGEALERVGAPTLLIVGSADPDVLRLNEIAASRLGGTGKLAVVPGAGHLFEEPGALGQVAYLAGEWFDANLPADRRRRPEVGAR